MKRTLILTILLVLFSSVIFFTANSALTSTACPVGCGSTIVLNTSCNACSGTWCGPDGSHSFTTQLNGSFTLGCRCAGTYYFCIGGHTFSVYVDGTSNIFNPVAGGECPCTD